jgi:ribonuclease VapC
MPVVIDTSALLALLFDEPNARWVAERMAEAGSSLRMSTVNLTEALIHLRDRQPRLAAAIERKLLAGPIRFVPPTVEQARIAAEARLRWPLNLGDCFAYALAATEGAPLLALDGDFRRVDVAVLAPP